MQVTSTSFLPLLVSVEDEQVGPHHLLDEFLDPLRVAYSFGPPYGDRLVTWADLDELRVNRRALRRAALDHLDVAGANGLRVHGQPPALMLSFAGLECSALLIDEFWADLRHSVPGEMVVGVPARDVVIVTSSRSVPGLEKVRRAVDRVFFAGGAHLLSRDLLIWRDGEWQPFTSGPDAGAVSRPAGTPAAPPVRPDREVEAEPYPEPRAPWPGEGRRRPARPRTDPGPGTRRPTDPTR